MLIHCPGDSQPVRSIELSTTIEFSLNKHNQIITDRFARENVFNEQQIQCYLYIYFSEKYYRFSLMLKIKKDLLMKIKKLLILHEREYKYKNRLRIVSDTNVATTASYEYCGGE